MLENGLGADWWTSSSRRPTKGGGVVGAAMGGTGGMGMAGGGRTEDQKRRHRLQSSSYTFPRGRIRPLGPAVEVVLGGGEQRGGGGERGLDGIALTSARTRRTAARTRSLGPSILTPTTKTTTTTTMAAARTIGRRTKRRRRKKKRRRRRGEGSGREVAGTTSTSVSDFHCFLWEVSDGVF